MAEVAAEPDVLPPRTRFDAPGWNIPLPYIWPEMELWAERAWCLVCPNARLRMRETKSEEVVFSCKASRVRRGGANGEGQWRLSVGFRKEGTAPWHTGIASVAISEGPYSQVGTERPQPLPDFPRSDLTAQERWLRDVLLGWLPQIQAASERASAVERKRCWELLYQTVEEMSYRIVNGSRGNDLVDYRNPYNGPETAERLMTDIEIVRGGGYGHFVSAEWKSSPACETCGGKGIVEIERCTGHCCEGFGIGNGHDFKVKYDGTDGEGGFVADMILPVDPNSDLFRSRHAASSAQSASTTLPVYDKDKPETHASWMLSSCRHFCRDSRKCQVFADPRRPSMCDRFPNGSPCNIPGCTRRTRYCDCVTRAVHVIGVKKGGQYVSTVTGQVIGGSRLVSTLLREVRKADDLTLLDVTACVDTKG